MLTDVYKFHGAMASWLGHRFTKPDLPGSNPQGGLKVVSVKDNLISQNVLQMYFSCQNNIKLNYTSFLIQ